MNCKIDMFWFQCECGFRILLGMEDTEYGCTKCDAEYTFYVKIPRTIFVLAIRKIKGNIILIIALKTGFVNINRT